MFELLYPNYNKSFYSYDAFIVAARAFPKFLNEGNHQARLRELAAWSAHIQQETAGEFQSAVRATLLTVTSKLGKDPNACNENI